MVFVGNRQVTLHHFPEKYFAFGLNTLIDSTWSENKNVKIENKKKDIFKEYKYILATGL